MEVEELKDGFTYNKSVKLRDQEGGIWIIENRLYDVDNDKKMYRIARMEDDRIKIDQMVVEEMDIKQHFIRK